jgi:hypothetical protein
MSFASRYSPGWAVFTAYGSAEKSDRTKSGPPYFIFVFLNSRCVPQFVDALNQSKYAGEFTTRARNGATTL